MKRDNVIEIVRRDSLSTPHILNVWRARASQDPDWAVEQIDRLLERALRAERELERLLRQREEGGAT